MDNGSSGEGATGPVKSLLSRWREKVFVLLVQQKLQQIQDNKERLEMRAKVIGQHPHHVTLESICSIGFLSLYRDCTLLQVCKYSYRNIASQKYVTMLWKPHVCSAFQFSEEVCGSTAPPMHVC